MSPRIKEVDHRGYVHLMGDVPDCDGRYAMADGSSVAVYMGGVNPAVGLNELRLEFENIQVEETVEFDLDESGVGQRLLRDVRGNERQILVELHDPLYFPREGTDGQVMVPNVQYVPGVV